MAIDDAEMQRLFRSLDTRVAGIAVRLDANTEETKVAIAALQGDVKAMITTLRTLTFAVTSLASQSLSRGEVMALGLPDPATSRRPSRSSSRCSAPAAAPAPSPAVE